MFAFTPDRGRKTVETEEDVRREFAVFEMYFMLEGDDGTSLLATGEGFGPFGLEWFPATRDGMHLKLTEELSGARCWTRCSTTSTTSPNGKANGSKSRT